ncbi:hypothetical protein F2P45_01680 [Massilia sp. CCM 8733]|uniref:HEAT repeat domain-containing protein n=1 Tax=Massilia mucilaginosa TaxID=2609282 RepID=A0ABX0NLT3_9BURK|nr:hypothetical protein [Massilia mucilaginosa]NHZ87748.1 hypothetical protein [Massilia mucilaginosa]
MIILESPIQPTKLSREAFAAALKHGRGAVVMHVREHGMDDVEDLVLAACIEDRCFDRQCEGSRAGWMYSLFKGTPAYHRFVGPILAALANSTDDRDADQLRELASLMGRDGDLEAASALRSFVWAQTFSADSVLGAAALCALDGIPAVVEMARRLGKVVQQDPDAWVDTVDRLTDDALPFDDVFAELKRVAAGDEAVAAYVAREEARIARDAAHDRSPESEAARTKRRGEEFMSQNLCDTILAAAARKSTGRGLFLQFGRWAGEEDLTRILDHLRVEPDPKVAEKLLWIFRRATLPYLDEHVWELASHSAIDVRNAAVRALSNLSDARVRELGRARLGDPGFSSEFSEEIELFKNSFQPGDETLILAALERQPVDGDDAHALASSAIDVCTSVRSPALAGVAQWVYRTNPCSICRRQAVELLLEWDCLPAHIAAECRHDASEDLRALFGVTP